MALRAALARTVSRAAPPPAGEADRPTTIEPANRRRRPAARFVLTVTLLFIVLLSAAAVEVVLISGQRRLDRLERDIERAQVIQDDLRRREAELRSPAQIAQIAADKLGMVHAAPPVLVSPPPRMIGSPETSPAPTSAPPPISGTP